MTCRFYDVVAAGVRWNACSTRMLSRGGSGASAPIRSGNAPPARPRWRPNTRLGLCWDRSRCGRCTPGWGPCTAGWKNATWRRRSCTACSRPGWTGGPAARKGHCGPWSWPPSPACWARRARWPSCTASGTARPWWGHPTVPPRPPTTWNSSWPRAPRWKPRSAARRSRRQAPRWRSAGRGTARPSPNWACTRWSRRRWGCPARGSVRCARSAGNRKWATRPPPPADGRRVHPAAAAAAGRPAAAG